MSVKRPDYVVHARDHQLHLGRQTQIMGILNITPDSFSQDGLLQSKQNYLTVARRMIRQGASILDVGGESTRPGASRVSVKEEINRIIPAIRSLVKSVNVPISADTYKPTVAKQALDAGASIINNIMGVKPEKSLLKMIRDYEAAIVLMHIQGTPRTMQKKITYRNCVDDIGQALRKSIDQCLEAGIDRTRILIDPGIGFGKTVEHNLQIINQLDHFHSLKCPLLMGTSRKSFIGKTLDLEVHQRLHGSLATVCSSIMKGAHIVRVHDVKETVQAARMTDAVINEKVLS